MRTVIFHYHLFKNAGTSVDELLRFNFSDKWITREFYEDDHLQNLREVEQWLLNEQDAIAFASHTAMLPPPVIEGVNVIPVIFVRHPIDRIVSAYMFEKNQDDSGFGAVLAKSTTLAGYIDVRLSLPLDIQCRNFHANRFGRMFFAGERQLEQCALQAINDLPFVGLVEEFDKSIEKMGDIIRRTYPEFKLKTYTENVVRDLSVTLDERMASVRHELGQARYEKLLEANSIDMLLYEKVKERYSA